MIAYITLFLTTINTVALCVATYLLNNTSNTKNSSDTQSNVQPRVEKELFRLIERCNMLETKLSNANLKSNSNSNSNMREKDYPSAKDIVDEFSSRYNFEPETEQIHKPKKSELPRTSAGAGADTNTVSVGSHLSYDFDLFEDFRAPEASEAPEAPETLARETEIIKNTYRDDCVLDEDGNVAMCCACDEEIKGNKICDSCRTNCPDELHTHCCEHCINLDEN